MHEHIEQFRAAIHSAGLNPPEVIEPDGKLHRFATNGKRSDDAGWYVHHDDGIPAGTYGDWRTGASKTWRSDIGRRLSPQKEAVYRERAARAAGLVISRHGQFGLTRLWAKRYLRSLGMSILLARERRSLAAGIPLMRRQRALGIL